MIKNSPASLQHTGSIPGVGRSHTPWSNTAHVPQLLRTCSRARPLQQEKLLQWEDHAPQQGAVPAGLNYRSPRAGTDAAQPETNNKHTHIYQVGTQITDSNRWWSIGRKEANVVRTSKFFISLLSSVIERWLTYNLHKFRCYTMSCFDTLICCKMITTKALANISITSHNYLFCVKWWGHLISVVTFHYTMQNY